MFIKGNKLFMYFFTIYLLFMCMFSVIAQVMSTQGKIRIFYFQKNILVFCWKGNKWFKTFLLKITFLYFSETILSMTLLKLNLSGASQQSIKKYSYHTCFIHFCICKNFKLELAVQQNISLKFKNYWHRTPYSFIISKDYKNIFD